MPPHLAATSPRRKYLHPRLSQPAASPCISGPDAISSGFGSCCRSSRTAGRLDTRKRVRKKPARRSKYQQRDALVLSAPNAPLTNSRLPKEATMASFEGNRSPFPAQPSSRFPKLCCYETLFLWNQGVDQLLALLRGMGKFPFASKSALQCTQVEIEEIHAGVNADFVE